MINKKVAGRVIRYAAIILISFAFLIPLAWMLISSLKDPVHVFEFPVNWFPEKLRFDNYIKLFTQYQFQNYILNTLKLCVLNMLGTAVSCTLVAYGFTFGKWKHKNKLFLVVLATMMLPGTVVFFPQFILFVKLKWYGTSLPLWVMSFFGSAYYVFFLRQYFLTIPTELTKAARIDGCGDWKMIWHVVIPMSRPVYIVMLMNTFISVWGDFFNQLIYITRNERHTVMMGLSMLNSSYGDTTNSTLPSLMGGSFIVSIPVLLVYYLGNKIMMKTYVFRETEK
jgi:ABC-type glycerol-3-phosphate transport system permease component